GPLPPPPGGATTLPARTPAAPRRLRVVLGLAALILAAAVGAVVYFHQPGPALPPAPSVKEPPTPEPVARAGQFPDAIPKGGWPLRLGGRVRAVAFSPDNRWFAAGSLSREAGDGVGGAALWPRTSGAEGTRFLKNAEVRHIVFTPAG